jgi:hypothetical protein
MDHPPKLPTVSPLLIGSIAKLPQPLSPAERACAFGVNQFMSNELPLVSALRANKCRTDAIWNQPRDTNSQMNFWCT